jgi:opacity protein-like surface antigen
MKSSKYVLILIFIWIINPTQAQIKHYDFNILAYGGIGFGVMENDSDPNYNMNSNSADILLKYRITQKLGIATGIGLNELSGDGFNINGNFHHERKLLKIPLLAILDYTISDHFSVIPNLGVYANYIFEDEYRFLNSTQKNIFEEWNFGAQLGVGLVFKLYTNFHLGFNYGLQYDLSKFSSSNKQLVINNKQKLGRMNSLGIVLVMEL